MHRRGEHVLFGQLHRARAGHAGEPLFQHHVIAQPFQQGLEQMGMGVDHARNNDRVTAIQHFAFRVRNKN